MMGEDMNLETEVLEKDSRRWSQATRRLPAKQLQVGSTPTGAYIGAILRRLGIPADFNFDVENEHACFQPIEVY
jgi:hypothetical protein